MANMQKEDRVYTSVDKRVIKNSPSPEDTDMQLLGEYTLPDSTNMLLSSSFHKERFISNKAYALKERVFLNNQNN